jgi:AAA domain-containing protein
MRLETPCQLEKIARKINGAASATTGRSDRDFINVTARENRGPELETISADKLAGMDLPPVKYIVAGYIAEGLTVLAGRPKVGKSWMALGLAIAVASPTGHALGSIPVEQGDVLYLALEDNNRRLKRRLNQMCPSGSVPARLDITIACPRLDRGGIEMIKTWADRHPGARLIVIDVFKKVRPDAQDKDSLYDSDYRAIEPLKQLADERGIGILVLHHTRKMPADDPFDTVSGSTGLTGAADTVLVLARDPQGGTTLYARGRDIEEIETAVQFDRMDGSWTILGAASVIRLSDARQEILCTLRAAAEPMSPREVADITGRSPDAVRKLLTRMWEHGEVQKAKRGQYSACDPPNPCHNGHNVTTDYRSRGNAGF